MPGPGDTAMGKTDLVSPFVDLMTCGQYRGRIQGIWGGVPEVGAEEPRDELDQCLQSSEEGGPRSATTSIRKRLDKISSQFQR